MNKGQRLKRIAQQVAKEVSLGQEHTAIAYGTLDKINPPTFIFEGLDPLDKESIITPKYKVFTPEDIGKKYVFMKNIGGQTYFYMYEAAPQGENGVEYKWKGRIDWNLP